MIPHCNKEHTVPEVGRGDHRYGHGALERRQDALQLIRKERRDHGRLEIQEPTVSVVFKFIMNPITTNVG